MVQSSFNGLLYHGYKFNRNYDANILYRIAAIYVATGNAYLFRRALNMIKHGKKLVGFTYKLYNGTDAKIRFLIDRTCSSQVLRFKLRDQSPGRRVKSLNYDLDDISHFLKKKMTNEVRNFLIEWGRTFKV